MILFGFSSRFQQISWHPVYTTADLILFHICVRFLGSKFIVLCLSVHSDLNKHFKFIFMRNLHCWGIRSSLFINPIALRTAKTLWRFGHSECNRVNFCITGSETHRRESQEIFTRRHRY